MSRDLLAPRPLGSTGLTVPAIAIGCAPLGNMPDTFGYEVSAECAHATVWAALDSPLNWLDTAAAYADGESERRIGSVLKELGGLPDGAFLDTKAGSGQDGDFSADTVKRRFLRSLELIELVFLHDPEISTCEDITAPEGPLAALQQFRDEGLIGHLGVAGGPIDLEIRYVETGIFDAVITHNRYTLLNRDADPLLTVASDKGLAVINAAPYGSGILAKGPSRYPRYAYADAPAGMLERATQLEAICARHDVPLAAAALQFSLRDPRITATIVGMSRPERIWQTVDLAQREIPDDCWTELMRVPFDTGNPQ
jgi:D-threo-aldose 1-dehydrogenase